MLSIFHFTILFLSPLCILYAIPCAFGYCEAMRCDDIIQCGFVWMTLACHGCCCLHTLYVHIYSEYVSTQLSLRLRILNRSIACHMNYYFMFNSTVQPYRTFPYPNVWCNICSSFFSLWSFLRSIFQFLSYPKCHMVRPSNIFFRNEWRKRQCVRVCDVCVCSEWKWMKKDVKNPIQKKNMREEKTYELRNVHT